MGAVAYRARAELRRRWPTVVVIALLVAISGTAALATAAGARRTAGTVDRFIDETQPIDVFVFAPTPISDETFAELAAIDGVTDIGRLDVPALYLPQGRGETTLVGLVDGYGPMSKSPRLLQGRRVDPGAPFEITLNEQSARALGVGLGDTVDAIAFAPEQLDAIFAGEEAEPTGPDYRFDVVGITREGVDFAMAGDPSFPGLTGAFLAEHGDEVAHYGYGLAASVDGGLDAEADFFRAARPLLGPEGDFDGSAGDLGGMFDAAGVMATALWVSSAVAGLTGLVVFVAIAGRATRLIGRDHPALGALGLSRPQQVGATMAVIGAGVALGTVGAVGGAVLASRWFPTGLLRRAEPDLGVDLDPLVLGLGGAVVLVLALTAAGVLAWRNAAGPPARAGGRRPTARLSSTFAGLRAPTEAVVGADMALRRGPADRRLPAASAVVGVAFAAAGVVAAIAFASSLDRLLTEPARWGWGWDTVIDAADADPGLADRLMADDAVAGLGLGRFLAEVDVGGRRINTQGIEPRKGSLAPTVAEGRAPVAPDEVALGADTLRALDVEIGDTVRAACVAGPCELRVVGQALMTSAGETLPVAEGASLTLEGFERLNGTVVAGDTDGSEGLLVRWGPGVDGDAAERRLGLSDPLEVQPPSDLARLDTVSSIPWLLAGFVAVVGLMAMGYALVTGLQARRRDLGVLRALGFVRRQVSAAIGWQATVLVVIAVVVGVPLGIIAGRRTWELVAANLGVDTDVSLPPLAVVLLALVTIAIANLVAVGPAWAARRTSPADALRTE